MIRTIKDYFWFIKESQSFMEGEHHPVVIFFMSLYKGFGFCKNMNKWYKGELKHD